MHRLQIVRCLCTQRVAIKREPNTHGTLGTKESTSSSIREAEKVVGYSTSFLNLRWLLNDEVANIALYLKKISGTEHPLLKIAKDVLFKSQKPPWGLIVLLVSKAGGFKKEFLSIDQDITAGILHSQRVLAEVTEMIRTGFLVHNGVMTIEKNNENENVLEHGNKIALLGGDYLLSKSFSDLSSLRNQKVNHIISTAIRDYSECIFLNENETVGGLTLPNRPSGRPKSKYCVNFSEVFHVDYGPYRVDELLGHPLEEWTLRTVLTGGNLLGKSCRAALLLSGHSTKAQENAYLFGKNLALAWQAFSDLQEFNEGKINLLGAPIMLALAEDSKNYKYLEEYADKPLLQEKICDIILESNAINKTKELREEYSQRALMNLESFDDCSAKESLKNLILAF